MCICIYIYIYIHIYIHIYIYKNVSVRWNVARNQRRFAYFVLPASETELR